MLGRLTAAALVLVLAACGRPTETVQAPAAAPAPAPAGSAPDPLSIRPTGVGPISDGTPFDRAVIERAFPGATIESAELQFAEERTPVLNVLAGGTQALTIASDGAGSVSSVSVTGGDYVGPGGERLMARWPATGFTIDQCVMGEARFVNALLCRRPDAPQVAYVFGIPDWTSNELPPADVLAERAFIREILWTADPA